MKPDLREACPDDYAVLAAWLPDAGSAWRWYGGELRWPLAPALLAALAGVADGASHVLAPGDGQPVAFGQYWQTGPGVVQLGRLIVAPELRRQGLGRRLCGALVEAAVQARGARSITLRVAPDHIAARNLFARQGFQAVPGESDPGWLFMRTMVRRPAA